MLTDSAGLFNALYKQDIPQKILAEPEGELRRVLGAGLRMNLARLPITVAI